MTTKVKKTLLPRTLLAVLLASTMLGGYALHARADGAGSVADTGLAAPRMPDFAALVKRVKPAVVSITAKMDGAAMAEEEGPQMRQMPPGLPFGRMAPRGGQQPERVVEARGSGFIVSADGVIVTNNHVVEHATSLSVTLDDGTELPATIVGRDSRSDVAVIRVKADHALPAIDLGSSADVEPGQWVVAMGNPFGLGGSVTAGIVSARGRDIGAGPYDDFIQIDAPINHGNSGGPLFTQDGHVIGINTAIYSPSGGSVGIGFAIPSDTVRKVVAQIEKDGHVTRGYIGVSAQKLNGQIAAAMGLPKAADPSEAGALIASVVSDGPAAKAGLQPGDVITKVDGQSVRDPRGLGRAVADLVPGQSARLQVLRDGDSKELTLKIAPQPGETMQASAAGAPEHDATPRLGLSLAPLSPQARAQLEVPAGTQGVVIAEVAPGSPAERAGLQQGDVLLGVGQQTIGSPEEAVKALRAAAGRGGKAVALRILRDGQAVFVALAPRGGTEAG